MDSGVVDTEVEQEQPYKATASLPPTHYVDSGMIDKENEHKQAYKAIASNSATYKASMHAKPGQREHSKDVHHCTHMQADAPFSR